jgi:hypothetical protein
MPWWLKYILLTLPKGWSNLCDPSYATQQLVRYVFNALQEYSYTELFPF